MSIVTMRRGALSGRMTVWAAGVMIGTVGAAGVVEASLVYSGDNLATNPAGTMTITSQAPGGSTLWQLTLEGGHARNTLQFAEFYDSAGGFNYASPGGNGPSMWEIVENDGTFQELEKSADAYRFSLSESFDSAGTSWTAVTTFTINTASAGGTSWTAERTITNVGAANGNLVNEAGFSLNLSVAGYTAEDADATLDGQSGWTDRYHRDANDPDNHYLWLVQENVDRAAGGFDPSDFLAGRAIVLDNAKTLAEGMTPGLEFSAWSDIVGYYPADSIGDATVVASGGVYNRRLVIEANPREWRGDERDVHRAGMAPGESYTVHYGLDINIAVPEPTSMMLAAGGLACLLVRRPGA